MAEDSVALGAYRKALTEYFEAAEAVVEVSEQAQEVEERQVKAFEAVGRERGLIDEGGKVADPRAIVALQAKIGLEVLAELGWDAEHPVAKSVRAQFEQLNDMVDQYEELLTQQSGEGPLL